MFRTVLIACVVGLGISLYALAGTAKAPKTGGCDCCPICIEHGCGACPGCAAGNCPMCGDCGACCNAK